MHNLCYYIGTMEKLAEKAPIKLFFISANTMDFSKAENGKRILHPVIQMPTATSKLIFAPVADLYYKILSTHHLRSSPQGNNLFLSRTERFRKFIYPKRNGC